MPKVPEFLPNPVFTLLDAVEGYIGAHPGEGHFNTGIDGFTIGRSGSVKPPAHHIFKPSLCVVLQGAKWATFGEKKYDYRAGQALIVSLEIPSFGGIAQASADRPYLGIMIEFDLTIMRE